MLHRFPNGQDNKYKKKQQKIALLFLFASLLIVMKMCNATVIISPVYCWVGGQYKVCCPHRQQLFAEGNSFCQGGQ